MATNTFKSGVSRLSSRYLSKEQRVKINASRNMFAPTIYNNDRPESPDTIERRKIHETIKKMVEEGKNKSEIVATLISEFPESTLRKFFDSYAQHHIDKKNTEKGRDDE